MEVTLPNGFTPRPYQRRIMRYFDGGGKRACWVVHRRGGKDLTMMHQTCKMAHRRTAAYWHLYPTAEEARKSIWEGFTKDGQRIMEQVFPKAIRKSPREWTPGQEMVVELKCGSIWRLFGSDHVEVVGAGPAGVVLSEYAIAKPSAWHLIRPMLRENQGWAAFIYTPRGSNHGRELYEMAKKDPSWFCELLTLYDTRAYDPETTILEERAEGMPEELINQEYLCDFSGAMVGSYYGRLLTELQKRGGLEPFTHDLNDVFTYWDLGIGDYTSIWFFRHRVDGLEFIDHYENNGEPMRHYFDLVDRWGKERGYQFKKHWLPHDARARSLQTGRSILEQAAEHWGISKVDLGPELSLEDGIQGVRWLLQQPGTRIHPRCSQLNGPNDSDGIECLRQYRREWDSDKKCFKNKPCHDWTSHTADAMRGAALVAKLTEILMRKPAQAKEKPLFRTWDSLTMDELRADAVAMKQGRRRI